jgi:hypothetical protein
MDYQKILKYRPVTAKALAFAPGRTAEGIPAVFAARVSPPSGGR